jgi:hypothetical protein
VINQSLECNTEEKNKKIHTEKNMFEKTIRLNFVQRRLQQALLVQLLVVVVGK